MPAPTTPPDVDNLSLPRILCLHGGGTNGDILRVQARSFINELAAHYRLVFADAPFLCEPHPAIIPVYEAHGPFRMWYRWKKDQRRCGGECRPESGETADEFGDAERDDDEVIVDEMEYQMRSAMEADEREGGEGEWVGLLGFSQGARIAGSILYDRQLQIEEAAKYSGKLVDPGNNAVEDVNLPDGFAGANWRFGFLIAGQGPFITLSSLGRDSGMTAPPGLLPDPKLFPKVVLYRDANGKEFDVYNMSSDAPALTMPTIHIQGLKDPGHVNMRRWFHEQFAKSKRSDRSRGTTLIEWVGDHRLPFRSQDMAPIIEAILEMGEATT